MKKVEIYDSTLRDGAQMHKISFSIQDKIKIVKKLDEFGVSYIEAGNPGSNPKEKEFFKKIKEIKLENSKLVAFGSTRRSGILAKDDENLQAILEAETRFVTLYGKAWDFHVKEILKTTLVENLKMISSSIKFMVKNRREVFFDAEHFFDGYKNNPEYAIQVIKTAVEAGASRIILCDTNGGTLTTEIAQITKYVCKNFKNTKFGIHCHNDMDLAVANSLIAVDTGIVQIQGTINGLGERCGNTNLCSIIPTLILKKDCNCLVNKENLKEITQVSKFVAEVANVNLNIQNPYVGELAFTHKAGAHINAINKNSKSFEHINPEEVGNNRNKVISELAGKSAIYEIVKEYGYEITEKDERLKEILENLKSAEKDGYQYEDAQGSIELLVAKNLKTYKNFIKLEDIKVIVEKDISIAIVKVKIKDKERLSSAEGNGPVDALNKALRKAIGKICEGLINVKLVDYKVRVIESSCGSDNKCLVNIQTSNGKEIWGTVGVSTDIVEASCKALLESFEYARLKKFI